MCRDGRPYPGPGFYRGSAGVCARVVAARCPPPVVRAFLPGVDRVLCPVAAGGGGARPGRLSLGPTVLRSFSLSLLCVAWVSHF